MSRIDEIREILEKEFGIKTAEELNEAIKKMKPIDIGLFVSPLKKEEAIA
ncbi:hypothetical protein [Calorimonas adulescens]|jgi:hypothetical protein|nr:hypothetical protein [Calorimonas adulescens]